MSCRLQIFKIISVMSNIITEIMLIDVSMPMNYVFCWRGFRKAAAVFFDDFQTLQAHDLCWWWHHGIAMDSIQQYDQCGHPDCHEVEYTWRKFFKKRNFLEEVEIFSWTGFSWVRSAYSACPRSGVWTGCCVEKYPARSTIANLLHDHWSFLVFFTNIPPHDK